MRRVKLSLAAALLVSTIALPVAARVDGGCGNGQGWTLIPANVELLVATYPSLERALTDEIYTLEDLVAQLDARDKNGNGWVCTKDVYAWSTGKSGGANAGSAGFFYFINAVDDNAAPK